MSRYQVFVTCNIGEEALDRLRNQGYEVEVYEDASPPPRELLLEKVSSGVDGLVTTLRDRLDEEVFKRGEKTLKVISQFAVGFDNIDRNAANRYRIPFTNTPDVLTDATAEFALFMMGCVARKLYQSERLVREKQWTTWHPWKPFLGHEVSGKTVGVIGTGRIGRSFISKCVGLDMSFMCYNRSQDEDFVESIRNLMDLRIDLKLSSPGSFIRYASLEEVLETSDFVSLHVPLNEDTRHLIDEAALKRMKSTAYLINTARGPVVDETALYRALKDGWIAGAALDVFSVEPLPDDSPFHDPELEDRLRLFHHSGSAARDTRLSPDPDVGMAGRCVQGMLDVLEGNYQGDLTRMPFVVNKEAFKN